MDLKMRNLQRFGLGFGFIFVFGACASPLLLPANKNELREVRGAFYGSISGRAPLTPSARLDANPEDGDYRSEHAQSPTEMGCKSPSALLAEVPIGAAQNCLRQLTAPLEVTYTLDTSFPPAWVMSREEEDPQGEGTEMENNPPACLFETLGRIPVYREVFFIGMQDGRCWSRSLGVEIDRWMGTRWEHRRPHFQWTMTSAEALDLERRLVRFSLSPFLEKSELRGKIVPERFCRGCLGDSNFERWSRMPFDSIEGPRAESWGIRRVLESTPGKSAP